ncbi:MAG: ABC transporter ATP-binding protein, partial [Acidimicrobiia bacterium]|nr:ABC transporter ATP-binding protein [Acidimicrobiia bacterium]
MRGTAVTLRGLRKAYQRGVPAVDGVDLEVAPGSLVALVGPSGCGKTTTLKMVAGLLDPDAGDVRFDDRSVVRLPVEKRPVAMVFQKPLLFPHMSVGQNVGFGLRVRRAGKTTITARVAEMLELVRLPGLAERKVGQLSGGQEQRVALARALVTDPEVLLLDEPLSQLDAALRVEMRDLVAGVQRELGVTTLFVTHDQDEAVVLADRVALLLDGRVVQHAEPRAFYERPASMAVARFFGVRNAVAGTVVDGRFTGGGLDLAVPAGT